MKNNKKIILYLCVAIFGILGVYLTFFAGGTDKYDSEAKAYKIYPNESYDSDDGTTYRPIYYFKVDGKEYECQAKTSSSSYPNENKNTVYYDSADPTNCKTEYEKTSSRVAGIICLITTAIMIYLFFIKKVADNSEGSIQGDGEYPLAEETAEKIIGIIGKVQLIYKRVIIGIIIIVLLVFILIDTILLKQTIKARDYIERAVRSQCRGTPQPACRQPICRHPTRCHRQSASEGKRQHHAGRHQPATGDARSNRFSRRAYTTAVGYRHLWQRCQLPNGELRPFHTHTDTQT